MNRKFTIFAGGFVAAAFGVTFGMTNVVVLYLLYAATVIFSLFLILQKNWKGIIFLLVGALLGAAWNIAYLKSDERIPPNIEGENHVIGAQVTDYSRESNVENGVNFTAEIDKIDGRKLEKPIRATVYYADAYARLKPGDRLAAKAKFSIPENTEDFAAETYYKTRRIDAMVFAEADGMITRCEKVPFKYLHKTLRFKIQGKIARLLPEQEGAFLNALIVGDKTNLSETIKEEMRITGLSHTIAISGMHISFLVGLLILLFGKKYGSIIALPVMLVFVLVAGSTPSVIRAFVMQCFIIFAPFVMREADTITSLFAAAFVILVINPNSIGDVGMQLSFTSTLGLIMLSGKLNRKMIRKLPTKIWKWSGKLMTVVSGTVAATVSATLFTMPIVIYYYGTVSLISPVANVIVLWAISLLFSLGVVAVALSFIWMGGAKLIAAVLVWLIDGIQAVVHALANIPYASVYAKDAWAIIGLVVLYAGVIFAYIGYKKKMRAHRYVAPACVLCCIVFIFISTYTPESPNVEFTGFDVGQGLSVMAEYRGSRVVIDCGGNASQNAGSMVYGEIIKRNTRHIDAIVLTHPHSDHTNGVEMLLSKANVDALYIPARTGGVPEMKGIIQAAHDRGTKVYAVDRDKRLDYGDMEIELLYCSMSDKENDIGIAAIVKKENFDVIVTGDLEAESEEYLVNEKRLPDTEVYIVGHHGANSSSSDYFLNEIKPEYAVISAGKNNLFGHPGADTLMRLKRRGIVYRRTDEAGTVRFSSGGPFKEEE